jgi:glycerol kinase
VHRPGAPTRGTTSAHLARAALEGIAFQVADVLSAMEADSGFRLQELRVDGGACANNLLMQFQADLLNVSVVRPAVQETTALGAAYLAGLAVGYWRDLAEIEAHGKIDRVFEPTLDEDRRRTMRATWTRAVDRAKAWEKAE